MHDEHCPIGNMGEEIAFWYVRVLSFTTRKTPFINAQRTGALAYLFPERRYPDGITSLNLRAFFNALLHCNDAAEASVTLNRAIQMAEHKAGCALDEIPVSEYPAWVLSSKERARTTSVTLTTSDVARIMQEYSGLLRNTQPRIWTRSGFPCQRTKCVWF